MGVRRWLTPEADNNHNPMHVDAGKYDEEGVTGTFPNRDQTNGYQRLAGARSSIGKGT